MMFPRVVGLLLESSVSITRFMQAFEEGYECEKLAGARRDAMLPSQLSSSSASPAAAAAHGVYGCPSRSCAVDGADCVMLQVNLFVL